MTELVGAWALPGATVDELSIADRTRMADVLGPGPRVELVTERLWLTADPAKSRRAGDAVCGWEGFVADGGLAPLQVDAFDARHDGHFVMVQHVGGRLRLLRSLSGGERLYVAKLGRLVLFAASIRPLLLHPSIERTLDPDVTDEVLLTGHPLFGTRTPIRGIEEVLPGHEAVVTDDGRLEQHWAWPQALRSPRGAPAALAKQFRDALCTAVERAVGSQRPVAVALSGGIDSSAIAAAAVEVVGADAVHAFTYEFDDQSHAPPETGYAKTVAKALGIRRHDVFGISFKDFLDALPEHVWRSESSVHWPKAFLLPVARKIASYGYDRYLTGFGIGSHMSYLREFAAALPFIPWPRHTLKYWRRVRFDAWDWLEHLAKIHPGLEPPHPRLYDLLLQVLEQRGVIEDHRAFYPPHMAALLERRARHAWRPAEFADDDRPLAEQLQRHAFAHLISCIDVTRSEKASREVGMARVAPAHFANCIPYAYFPIEPAPRLWSAARKQRPGKYLLQLAYRGVLPDEVLFRKKSWDDAVTSRAWRKRGRVFMLRALPGFPNEMSELGPEYPDAVQSWEPTSIQANCLSFWFWQDLFVRRPIRSTPPRWPELWGYDEG